MAGSADVESMYSSISGGRSVMPYIVRIFCLTCSWYSATRRSASNSTTSSCGMTEMSRFPKMDLPQMADRLALGFVEAQGTFRVRFEAIYRLNPPDDAA